MILTRNRRQEEGREQVNSAPCQKCLAAAGGCRLKLGEVVGKSFQVIV